MREIHSLIDQSVGNHIVFAVNMIHGPMNTALSESVAEFDARAEMRPQIGGPTSSLPTTKDYHLARDNL